MCQKFSDWHIVSPCGELLNYKIFFKFSNKHNLIKELKNNDKIIEIAKIFRTRQILQGKIEIPKTENDVESLNELLVHNPGDYSKEYFDPLDKNDIQT